VLQSRFCYFLIFERFQIQGTIELLYVESIEGVLKLSKGRRGKSETKVYDGYLWEWSDSIPAEERLQSAAEHVCSRYSSTQRTVVKASFYTYTGLKSTLKIDRGVTRIKVSDVLEEAPEKVLEALIHILIARALKRRPRPEYLQIYDHYTAMPEVEEKHAQVRTERSRKVLLGTKGTYYDLDEIFGRINREYFNSELPKPNLSWSPRRSKRLLGYHDGHLNLVVISRWLDRKVVPQLVVDFIMYHELLHIVVPSIMKNGRRIVHTQEFKQRDKQFRFYDEANRWLRRPGMGEWM